MNCKIITDLEGTIRYYVDDLLHREDGPAIERFYKVNEWYKHGKLHREDGPAVENLNSGTKEWWVNNKRHREDGPAIEFTNGTKYWYINGKKHREDGPAVELCSGTKEWWVNGERHREDGPAIIAPNHNRSKYYEYWYYKDNHINVNSQLEFEQYLRLMVFQ